MTTDEHEPADDCRRHVVDVKVNGDWLFLVVFVVGVVAGILIERWLL